MAHELPPLSAIRVFEAAARLGSFTKAAQELGMTQAAVSYQIKVLEERVGSPLFARRARQVALTETGARLAPRISDAFAAMADAWQGARGNAAAVLNLSSTPTFVSNWLAVRLGAFQREHPELAVRLDTSPRLVDFQREDMDVGIRVGAGAWPGLAVHYLFKADYTPMLSPQLAERIGGVRKPSDLYKLTLLGPDDPWWPNWFRTAGETFEPERVIRGPTLGAQAHEAMAAMAGQGVGILTRNLYESFLAQGQLIQPFEAVGSDNDGYYLVYAESRRNTPKIKAFRDWIVRETEPARARER